MSGRKCTACGSESLEPGFMPDVTQGGGLIARWYPGSPEKSAWTGLKIKRKGYREIEIWRCQDCSTLAMVAGPLTT